MDEPEGDGEEQADEDRECDEVVWLVQREPKNNWALGYTIERKVAGLDVQFLSECAHSYGRGVVTLDNPSTPLWMSDAHQPKRNFLLRE